MVRVWHDTCMANWIHTFCLIIPLSPMQKFTSAENSVWMMLMEPYQDKVPSSSMNSYWSNHHYFQFSNNKWLSIAVPSSRGRPPTPFLPGHVLLNPTHRVGPSPAPPHPRPDHQLQTLLPESGPQRCVFFGRKNKFWTFFLCKYWNIFEKKKLLNVFFLRYTHKHKNECACVCVCVCMKYSYFTKIIFIEA